MKKISWFLILLITIPVFAQANDPASAAFQALEVSNVRLRLSETDGASLIFNASPAVCEDLLIDVAVDGSSIEVHAFVPLDAGVCNTLVAYEPVIQLPDLETGQSYILYLNDFTSTFFLNDTDDRSTTEPFAALWGEDNLLIGFDPVVAIVDSVDFSQDASNVTLTGNHPDGCISDAYNRVYQDDVQSNLYHVEVLRLLPQGVLCPTELVPFEATIALDLLDGDVVEIVGDYYQLEANDVNALEKRVLTIESVVILPRADGIFVAVQGSQDCGFEMQDYILERDYVSAIDIVSYVSVDTPCADDITPYDKSFTVASLPVVINGTAYDENGEMSLPASAQSVTNPAEGNVMAVDTVIESVEVAILESFPMQLQLTVSGYQPDGCDFPVEVVQSVEGNDVTLHIFRNVPIDVMCPMIINPYNETISVDGTFEGGTVNIQVNDFTTSVDL